MTAGENYSPSSSETAENILIRLVLEGEYPPGSSLPPERELAARLGVARPTLREALRRLERDGWFTVRKGQPTAVNDFWQQGNLNTLVNIVRNTDIFSGDFIIYSLEIRAALAPSFVRDAVSRSPAKVVAALADAGDLEDSSESYAEFDWALLKTLAGLSGNPIYLLILNSYNAIYIQLARQYFDREECRRASQGFYRLLLAASMSSNSEEAARVTREAMEESIALWRGYKIGNTSSAPPDRRFIQYE
ncbi:MAG: GntR family transcriptional regulator [Bacillota bacterium]